MSRIILTTLAILFCSASSFGQDFVVPQNNSLQNNSPETNRASFQPPSTTGFQAVQNKLEPVSNVQVEKTTLRPAQTHQPVQQTEEPTIILPKKQVGPRTELPAPNPTAKAAIVELKEDTQVYRSSTPSNNSMGVSDYRFEVAKERARARRMRLEVKKWYGVDSARPVVAPRGNLPTYSAYYNGVFSRYGNQYNYGNSFYFHVPVAR